MDSKWIYFVLLSVFEGTFSFTIPVIGGQLPGIGNGIKGTFGGSIGGLLGGRETGNGIGSITGVNSDVKTVFGSEQGIEKGIATKCHHNTAEKSVEKIPGLRQGIQNEIDGTSGGGLDNLLGGGETGNSKISISGVDSVVKTAGSSEKVTGNGVVNQSIHNTSELNEGKSLDVLQGIGEEITGTSGGGFGGLFGGGGTGNSILGTMSHLGQDIKNEVATKLKHTAAEKAGEKRPDLFEGIRNKIEGASGGGLGNLSGGGRTGNGIVAILGVDSVLETVDDLGQGIERAVAKKIISHAAKQGMKSVQQFKTRVLKTIEDFFEDLYGTEERGVEKDSSRKTTGKSSELIQGVGNELLARAENAVRHISEGVEGKKAEGCKTGGESEADPPVVGLVQKSVDG